MAEHSSREAGKYRGSDLGLQPRATVVRLALLMGALMAVTAVVGFVASVGRPEDVARNVESVRGTEVTLYGAGLYEYDTQFIGAGNRATDVVMLALGLPLLGVSIALYRRGSVPGALLLLGALGFTWYVAASYAIGVAYNDLFLVYIAAFSAGLFALVLLGAQLAVLPDDTFEGAPRRGLAAFMFVSAAVLLMVWGAPVVAALIQGSTPDRLDTYTTFTTHVLDLGAIMPIALVAGVLIVRGRGTGFVLAASILVIAAMLAPLIAAQTFSQIEAGEEFTTAEVVGPMGGFVALSLASIWALTAILKSATEACAPSRG